MDNSVSDLYGGELTSDALLVLKEEDPADDHPASSPELGAQPHDAAAAHHKRSCVTMPTHRAVLWPLAEYFQSKVTTDTVVLCSRSNVLFQRLA